MRHLLLFILLPAGLVFGFWLVFDRDGTGCDRASEAIKLFMCKGHHR